MKIHWMPNEDAFGPTYCQVCGKPAVEGVFIILFPWYEWKWIEGCWTGSVEDDGRVFWSLGGLNETVLSRADRDTP